MKKKSNLSEEEKKRLKYEKDDQTYSIGIFICFAIMFLSVFLTTKGSQEYYRSQNGLFILIILDILASFAIIKYDKSIILNGLMKIWKLEFSFTSEERSDLTWMLNFILALVGLMIVDTSIFENGSMRIGAVTGIAFFKIIKIMFTKKSVET